MLTAVIASYNHEKYILECLEHIVKIETLQKVLVIDDGSTDGTPNLVSKFVTDNNCEDFVKLIKKANAGLVDTLNLGLKLCETEFIYFTASDDFVNADNFNIFVRQINHKSIFYIGGALNVFPNSTPTPVYTEKHRDFFGLTGQKLEKSLFLSYPHPILIQSTVFKTDYLRKIGGWDADILLDDYSVFVKSFLSMSSSETVVFNPDIIICNYRHHGNNSYKRNLWLFSAVHQVISKYAPKHLFNRAIGVSATYYIYKCLRYRQFKDFFSILKMLKPSMYFYICSALFERIVKGR